MNRKQMKISYWVLFLIVALVGIPGALAAAPVDYSTTIQPIFNAHCNSCHPTSGVSLTSYSSVMASTYGGSPIVIPSNATNSILYESVIGTGGYPKMPIGGSLSATDIQSIADWINQGALPAASMPVLTLINVTPETASLTVGGSQTFIAAGFDQSGASIAINPATVWSSSNNTVGTINDSTGVFTALAAGTATITAKNGTDGTVSGTATVTVAVPVPVLVLTSINVTPETASLTIGGSQTFTAAGFDQNSANITISPATFWSSSNNTVGKINDSTGVFTALAAGTATITATNGSGGTVSGTATVTVTSTAPAPVLTNITVSPATASLAVNGTQTFTATALDQLGNLISAIFTWVSSNPAVGSIDATGKFTALSAGTTTITASNGTVNGSALVSVTNQSIGHNDEQEEEHEQHNGTHEQEDHENNAREHANTEHNNTIDHTNTIEHNNTEHNNTVDHINTIEHTNTEHNNTVDHTNIVEHNNTQANKATTARSTKNKQD
jgi:uncharacterized protein YjdB